MLSPPGQARPVACGGFAQRLRTLVRGIFRQTECPSDPEGREVVLDHSMTRSLGRPIPNMRTLERLLEGSPVRPLFLGMARSENGQHRRRRF
jgi:hypothetical protein